MRYTRIDVEGGTGKFASLTRRRGSSVIEAEVIAPEGTTRLSCAVDDDAERRALAERLESELGAGDYAEAIRLLVDAQQAAR